MDTNDMSTEATEVVESTDEETTETAVEVEGEDAAEGDADEA